MITQNSKATFKYVEIKVQYNYKQQKTKATV